MSGYLRYRPHPVDLGALMRACTTGALMAAAAACQSDGLDPATISLEYEKPVNAGFDLGIELPPRTIRDITAVLDSESLSDPDLFQRKIDLAEESPPSGASDLDLAKFYHARSLAAAASGRSTQALEDLRLAVDYDRDSRRRVARMVMLRRLAWLEFEAGNFKSALASMEGAFKLRPRSVRNNSIMTELLASIGDIEGARRHADESRSLMGWRGRWRQRNWGLHSRSILDYVLLEAEGKWAEAEPSIRKTIADFTEEWRLGHQGVARAYYATAESEDVLLFEIAKWRSHLVTNLLRQGKIVEAEREARHLLKDLLKQWGKYHLQTADALRTLAMAIHVQGRDEEAEQLVRSALDVLEAVGVPSHSRTIASARHQLGKILLTQGQWRESLQEFDRTRSNLAENSYLYEKWYGQDVDVSLALLKQDRASEAVALLVPAHRFRRTQLGPDQYETVETQAILAMALAVQGESREALGLFQAAMPTLVERATAESGRAVADKVRHWRFRTILEGYLDFLGAIDGSSIADASGVDVASVTFQLADAARGSSVQRALAASSARAAARDPELAKLARLEQDMGNRLENFANLLANVLAAAPNQQNPDVIADLREGISTLSTHRAALKSEIERRFPDYAALINPEPARIETTRASLQEGEALVAIYSTEKRTYVWALPRSGSMAFAMVSLGREAIRRKVSHLRAAFESDAHTLDEIPAFDLDAAYKLYTQLLLPVAEAWRPAGRLIVVAHDALGTLPLSTLPTRSSALAREPGPLFSNYRTVPWLGRDHAITSLPSLTSLIALRTARFEAGGARPFIGFADPVFTPEENQDSIGDETTQVETRRDEGTPMSSRGIPVSLRKLTKTRQVDRADLALLPPLPETAEEITSIADALDADRRTSVYVGVAANEAKVKELSASGDLGKYRVISFATHGLVPGDLDGLTQPALALSHPKAAGIDGDGLLSMDEILTLKLNADWAVLSACNTATADGAGAEAVSGLGRAFFYAGTRALLVSNWPVETTSAKALTTDLFRRQAADPSLTRADALRQAMLGLIDGPGYLDAEGRTVFSYAHPIFWAPFSVVGDGGGVRLQGRAP